MLVIDAQEQTLVGKKAFLKILSRPFACQKSKVLIPRSVELDSLGIMTDKDLAFRVVAEGLDIRNTLISQVMTRVRFALEYV